MYTIHASLYVFYAIMNIRVKANEAKADYCSLCKPPGSHTMCLYPKEGPGERCIKYVKRVIDDKTKQELLYLHNLYRNKVALGWAENEWCVQPSAANMLQLMWHDELQRLAQRWADQCVGFQAPEQHDPCRALEEFDVGQNIITVVSKSQRPINYNESIREWYDEMKDYEPEWVQSYKGSPRPPKKISHYTQLVWAKTQYVGCASVTFQEIINHRKFIVNRIVCNYGPAGNIINTSVYRLGRTCSKCPRETKCNKYYGGLCAPDDEIKPLVLPANFHNKSAPWVDVIYGTNPPIDDLDYETWMTNSDPVISMETTASGLLSESTPPPTDTIQTRIPSRPAFHETTQSMIHPPSTTTHPTTESTILLQSTRTTEQMTQATALITHSSPSEETSPHPPPSSSPMSTTQRSSSELQTAPLVSSLSPSSPTEHSVTTEQRTQATALTTYSSSEDTSLHPPPSSPLLSTQRSTTEPKTAPLASSLSPSSPTEHSVKTEQRTQATEVITYSSSEVTSLHPPPSSPLLSTQHSTTEPQTAPLASSLSPSSPTEHSVTTEQRTQTTALTTYSSSFEDTSPHPPPSSPLLPKTQRSSSEPQTTPLASSLSPSSPTKHTVTTSVSPIHHSTSASTPLLPPPSPTSTPPSPPPPTKADASETPCPAIPTQGEARNGSAPREPPRFRPFPGARDALHGRALFLGQQNKGRRRWRTPMCLCPAEEESCAVAAATACWTSLATGLFMRLL